ncbi:GNAT family N-acetyltransferase [Cupriavidus taiwanensis]|uniref:N-hydroxyornithine O-acetyltransferase, siderophore biosynthesis protein n=1 Tax=Cupriavidus taiwanensis TaxID=164546 RepID=A0A375J4N8_9BURK|nr:GNAT family N-acetyltransferase [Cupriavidus taiwanensis]SPS00124.1 N-hydroxyornithine O-acetyltransferase, siderophore biosynthesis protein [Cupriavidus taiwanensis]
MPTTLSPFPRHVSFAAAPALRCESRFDGAQLTVTQAAAAPARFALDGDTLRLLDTEADTAALAHAAMAALDAAFAHGAPRTLRVQLESRDAGQRLHALGVLVRDASGARGSVAHAELLWQRPELYLAPSAGPYPLRYTMTDGKRHPQRAPKPHGVVYARHIPWLDRTLTLRAAALERDLPLLHRWMNDPDVAYFWNEDGDEAKHRAYLQGLLDDPHMLPLIAAFDDVPFGYFEVYWAKENRIAPFYDAHDHDRGWHVLIGEPAFRGKAFLTAWFPAIQHYQFLDDPRTQRIVGEPRADHVRQIANLDKAGFSKVKEFDFPHKRAMLVMLLRERFFGEHLLLPSLASSSTAQQGPNP